MDIDLLRRGAADQATLRPLEEPIRYVLRDIAAGETGLFVCMLAFAALNRWRWIPPMQTAPVRAASIPPVLRELRVSVLAETLLGVLVLAAVSLLGTLEPPLP